MQDLTKIILNSSHSLIAGTTGSGKSTAIKSILFDIMKEYTPEQIKLVLIDLKRVELAQFKNAPHTLNFINDPKKVLNCLNAYIDLMLTRFKELEKDGKTQSNKTHIFIVIDELADLIQTNTQTIFLIAKIGRLARAVNIHLLLATQSPDRKTIPAIIQQNLTCCIALRCKTSIESRQVIGIAGAEKLQKYGFGIVWNSDGFNKINIPYTPKEKIDELLKQLKSKYK